MTEIAAAKSSVRYDADGRGTTGVSQDSIPPRATPPMASFAGLASSNIPVELVRFGLIAAPTKGTVGEYFNWGIPDQLMRCFRDGRTLGRLAERPIKKRIP